MDARVYSMPVCGWSRRNGNESPRLPCFHWAKPCVRLTRTHKNLSFGLLRKSFRVSSQSCWLFQASSLDDP